MNPPMRMLILLAVFWVAGSLLLAAESPQTSTPKPAATEQKTESAPQTADKSAADKSAADKKTEGDAKTGKTDAKTETKTDTKEAGKGSIAEQAEAALKAAAEADPGSASREASKASEQDAKDDTQLPPTGSVAKGPSPQRFTPTEQVRADFDVSFPIDI